MALAFLIFVFFFNTIELQSQTNRIFNFILIDNKCKKIITYLPCQVNINNVYDDDDDDDDDDDNNNHDLQYKLKVNIV